MQLNVAANAITNVLLHQGGDLYSALRNHPDTMRWERLGRKVALDVALGINYLHTRQALLCKMILCRLCCCVVGVVHSSSWKMFAPAVAVFCRALHASFKASAIQGLLRTSFAVCGHNQELPSSVLQPSVLPLNSERMHCWQRQTAAESLKCADANCTSIVLRLEASLANESTAASSDMLMSMMH